MLNIMYYLCDTLLHFGVDVKNGDGIQGFILLAIVLFHAESAVTQPSNINRKWNTFYDGSTLNY